MREPGEPTEAESRDAEHRFIEWCRENQLDPESQSAAREYEQWWNSWFPHGEEEQWAD